MLGAQRASKWRFVVLLASLSAETVLAQEGGGAVATNHEIPLLLGLLAALILLAVLWQVITKKAKQLNKPPSDTPPASQPSVTPQPVKPTGPKSIFISYRRQDSAYITGRIYDVLTAQFGKTTVFKDVDSMPLGFDFRDHIQEQVGRCSVLIAVIGKSWNAPSDQGDRRLDDQRDHLRIEIETALERRIPVIPVLVDGVEMPAEKDLPPSLAKLAYHHGISVRPDPDFHNDADRLARGVEPLLK
jgi:hypothetical protein